MQDRNLPKQKGFLVIPPLQKKTTLAHDSEDSCPGAAVESAVVQRMLVQSHASSQSVFVQNSENESFLNVALFFIWITVIG